MPITVINPDILILPNTSPLYPFWVSPHLRRVVQMQPLLVGLGVGTGVDGLGWLLVLVQCVGWISYETKAHLNSPQCS